MKTITGFMLRGYWMTTVSGQLQHRITLTTTKIVGTIFGSSGIALLVMLSLNPLSPSRLMIRLADSIAYILLGTVAICRGATLQIRTSVFVGALSLLAYVVGVALPKSLASWPVVSS